MLSRPWLKLRIYIYIYIYIIYTVYVRQVLFLHMVKMVISPHRYQDTGGGSTVRNFFVKNATSVVLISSSVVKLTFQ